MTAFQGIQALFINLLYNYENQGTFIDNQIMRTSQTDHTSEYILQLGIQSKKQIQPIIHPLPTQHQSDNQSCLSSNASQYQISLASNLKQTTLIDSAENKSKQIKCDASRNSSTQKRRSQLNAQQLMKKQQGERAINLLTQKVLKNLRTEYSQIQELMKLVEGNILNDRSKQIRKKISVASICSRNSKSKSHKQHSLTKGTNCLRNQKKLQRKQQGLSQKIIEQKQKLHTLSTKAVLLQNYIEVTSKRIRNDTISSSSQYSLTKLGNLGRKRKMKDILNYSQRKKVMVKRRDIVKQGILSSQHSIQKKMERLAQEKFLLKQELQIVKMDILRLQKEAKKYSTHRIHSLNKIKNPHAPVYRSYRNFRDIHQITSKKKAYLQRSTSNGSSQNEITKAKVYHKSKKARMEIQQQYFSGATKYKL